MNSSASHTPVQGPNENYIYVPFYFEMWDWRKTTMYYCLSLAGRANKNHALETREKKSPDPQNLTLIIKG